MPFPVIWDPATGKGVARPILAADTAFGSGAITSGDIASGQIGLGHIAFNSVGSGQIVDGSVGSGELAGSFINHRHIASGGVIGEDIGDGAVSSGKINANAVGGIHILNGSLSSLEYADNSIVSGKILQANAFGLAGVHSGNVASGVLGRVHIRELSISSGKLATNGTEKPVHSGNIASGSIGSFHLADESVLSGDVGSGQLASGHMHPDFIANIGGGGGLASGDTAQVAGDAWLAGEVISGIQAVLPFSGSRFLQVAMAGVSGRMPAIGVVDASGGISSGLALGPVVTHGVVDFKVASGFGVILDGVDNLIAFVGRSGTIQTGPPSNSGALQQHVLQVISSGFVVNIDPNPIQV